MGSGLAELDQPIKNPVYRRKHITRVMDGYEAGEDWVCDMEVGIGVVSFFAPYF